MHDARVESASFELANCGRNAIDGLVAEPDTTDAGFHRLGGTSDAVRDDGAPTRERFDRDHSEVFFARKEESLRA